MRVCLWMSQLHNHVSACVAPFSAHAYLGPPLSIQQHCDLIVIKRGIPCRAVAEWSAVRRPLYVNCVTTCWSSLPLVRKNVWINLRVWFQQSCDSGVFLSKEDFVPRGCYQNSLNFSNCLSSVPDVAPERWLLEPVLFVCGPSSSVLRAPSVPRWNIRGYCVAENIFSRPLNRRRPKRDGILWITASGRPQRPKGWTWISWNP